MGSEWKPDNDFVANLFLLLRGMSTPRKNEVLKFIEFTIRKVEEKLEEEHYWDRKDD